jgi:PPOX class probable FMN-dependent enzyme
MTLTASPLKPRITTLAELRELFGTPSERAVGKELSRLDGYFRRFIARSPFVTLATSGADGRCDVSPKGDEPGFVAVLDDHTLAIPDRPGNKRFDSLQNIMSNPHVGLLFMVPGMDETLRVNGTAELVRDPDLLDQLSVNGKQPMLAIVVHVEEAYFHCGRCSLRAQIWDPEKYIDRTELPSLARMISDQMRPANRSESEHQEVIQTAEERIAESYRCLSAPRAGARRSARLRRSRPAWPRRSRGDRRAGQARSPCQR